MPVWTEGQQTAWLRKLAREVRSRLAAEGLKKFEKSGGVWLWPSPWTDGWYVDLGDLKLPGARQVSLMLDTVALRNARRVWSGFFAVRGGRIRPLARHVAKHVGRPFQTLRPSDFEEKRLIQDEPSATYMVHPLRKSGFDRPTLEHLAIGHSAFGVYWSDAPRFDRAPSRELVQRVSRFLLETMTALESFEAQGGHPRQSKAAAERIFKNREVVVTGKVFTRSPQQAQQAKQRDNFTCGVCLERPEERYGVMGRAALEAHHIHPIHAQPRDNRTTVLAELLTVCANCHRVLTRLPASDRSLRQLQKRFAG